MVEAVTNIYPNSALIKLIKMNNHVNLLERVFAWQNSVYCHSSRTPTRTVSATDEPTNGLHAEPFLVASSNAAMSPRQRLISYSFDLHLAIKPVRISFQPDRMIMFVIVLEQMTSTIYTHRMN